MGDIMVEVHKLNKSFGSLHVLKDCDLTVQRSEVVVMIGARVTWGKLPIPFNSFFMFV